MLVESSAPAAENEPLRSTDLPARRRPKAAKVFLALVLCGFGLAVIFTKWPHYAGTSVCQECGLRRDNLAWDARFSPFTIYRLTKDSPTAVSRALNSNLDLTTHRHNWSASVTPAFEPLEPEAEPTPDLLYAVEAPRVAQLVTDLAKYTSKDVLEKWRHLVLDPRYALVFDSSLHYLRFPDQGFSARPAFEAWWRANEYPLWNHLRELTEAD